MSQQVSVKPTPIQRNVLDVAMELTALHVHNFGANKEELDQIFAKYYATAYYCHRNNDNLYSLVSEEILNKTSRIKSSGW
jgi:hypothetical protein